MNCGAVALGTHTTKHDCESKLTGSCSAGSEYCDVDKCEEAEGEWTEDAGDPACMYVADVLYPSRFDLGTDITPGASKLAWIRQGSHASLLASQCLSG